MSHWSKSWSRKASLEPLDGDRATVTHRRTGERLVVNQIGLAILATLQRGGTPAEAAAGIAADTGAPPERVGRDCAEFLRLLVYRGAQPS